MPPPLAELTDEEVLARVARADEAALAELYDRYGGVAYGLAHRILRDQSLAQDAVQEAFLAVWRTAASFDPRRGKASTWLLTFVHRRAVDVVRYEDRRRARPLDDAPIASGDATDETAAVREQRRAVQAALAQLPPDQRAALVLLDLEGYSVAEIAEMLGIAEGTVKSRCARGRARLAVLLGHLRTSDDGGNRARGPDVGSPESRRVERGGVG
jgi:RNA polymerase sigma-70 factor (ECF subfamily)